MVDRQDRLAAVIDRLNLDPTFTASQRLAVHQSGVAGVSRQLCLKEADQSGATQDRYARDTFRAAKQRQAGAERARLKVELEALIRGLAIDRQLGE